MFRKLRYIIDNLHDGLREARSGYAMIAALCDDGYIPKVDHYNRVAELLEANNRGVQERRELVAALRDAKEVIEEFEHQINMLSDELAEKNKMLGLGLTFSTE